MSFGIIVDSRKRRGESRFSDNPNASQLVKIGTEINKMVNHGERHRVEKEFGKEANDLCRAKKDSSLSKEIARNVAKQVYDLKKGK